MLTDKQSLILCAIIIVGFVTSGILNIFDNYFISGILLLLFLVVLINLVVTKRYEDPEDEADQNVK